MTDEPKWMAGVRASKERMERRRQAGCRKVFADKMKHGYWILHQFTGLKMSSSTKRAWPPAKGKRFVTPQEAEAFIDAYAEKALDKSA